MMLDHIVAAARDPDRHAAHIAGRVGRPWTSHGESEAGYRSAVVRLGDGLYLDVLWPTSPAHPAAGLVEHVPDGSLLAWVVEHHDPAGLADRIGLSLETERDGTGAPAYVLSGWVEAVRSVGLLPAFVSYGPAMAGRRERATTRWRDVGSGGVIALHLHGSGADRQRVQEHLESAGLDQAAEGIPIDWRPGAPGLRGVSVRTDFGAVVIGRDRGVGSGEAIEQPGHALQPPPAEVDHR